MYAVTDTKLTPDEVMPIAAYTSDGSHVWTNNGQRTAWQWLRSILPANQMPEWASRLRIEITEARVERVREMRSADVVAEGYPFSSDLDQFKTAWKSRYGKRYPWESAWCEVGVYEVKT